MAALREPQPPSIPRPLAIHRLQAALKNASCRAPLQRHFVSCLQPAYPPPTAYARRSTLAPFLNFRPDIALPPKANNPDVFIKPAYQNTPG